MSVEQTQSKGQIPSVGSGELVRCACGSTLFHRNYKARGVWRQLIDTSGRRIEVVDSSTDELKNYGEPKTMRCAECGKRHANPDFT